MNEFVILCVIALYGASYSAVEGASRIMGGLTASENQFRYMVSLQRISEVNELTRGHRCGGALITYSHALTAASCLYNNDNGIFTQILPTEYRLFAGSARLDNDRFADRIRAISNFTVHPQFTPDQRFINDIAFITTVEAFSQYVVTLVQLPFRYIDVTNPWTCQSSGWGGQNSSANASYQLMYTQNFVTVESFCQSFYYQQGTIINMQPSMLCAVPRTNTSGCQGDIGNPLVCNNEIAGILFLSKDCSLSIPAYNSSNASTWYPDVYTGVFSYKVWLEETVFGRPQTDGASTYQPGIGLLAIFALVHIVTAMS